MSESSFLSQLPQLLNDWLPKTASVAVANKHEYVVYRPGVYDLHITPGDSVRSGSIVERVFSQRQRVESEVDSSVFGIPYYGMGYPLQMENGVESALAVILPPRQQKSSDPLTVLMGQADGVWRPIAVDKVKFLESYQKKTWIHTENGTYATDRTLQSLESHLPLTQFIRIHRSYIVNIHFIDFIKRDDRSQLVIALKTMNQTVLPVAQTYVRHVRESLGF